MIAFEPPNPGTPRPNLNPNPTPLGAVAKPNPNPNPIPDPPMVSPAAEPEPEPKPLRDHPGYLLQNILNQCNMLVRPKVPKVSTIPDHGTGAASRYRV